jgi:hypothetical protein
MLRKIAKIYITAFLVLVVLGLLWIIFSLCYDALGVWGAVLVLAVLLLFVALAVVD